MFCSLKTLLIIKIYPNIVAIHSIIFITVPGQINKNTNTAPNKILAVINIFLYVAFPLSDVVYAIPVKKKIKIANPNNIIKEGKVTKA